MARVHRTRPTRSASKPGSASGFFAAEVTRVVDGTDVYVQVPRLTLEFEHGPVQYLGSLPTAGDSVWVSFQEGRVDELVMFTASEAGDISAVTAGTNLNGGGLSGAVTLNLDTNITGDITFDTSVLVVDATNNRIGIGTTAPAFPLSVAGHNINLAGYTSIGSTLSGAMSIFGHNVHADPSVNNKVLSTNTGYYGQMIKMYWNEGITFHAVNSTVTAGNAFFTEGGTTNELMRIANDGNVGIGTTTPAAPLQVNTTASDAATIQMNTTHASSKRTRLQFAYGGTQGWEWGTDISANGGTELYAYNRATAVIAMVMKDDGKVGIGQSAPVATLGVEASADPWMHIVDTGTGTQLFGVDGTAAYIASDTKPIYFKTGSTWNAHPGDSGSTVMAITTAGNVGIGTTTPGDQLHVYEAGTGVAWRGRALFGGQTNVVVAGEYNGVASIGAHNAALNAWAPLTLNFGGGNVGIGTTAPLQKFHQSGGKHIIDSTDNSWGQLQVGNPNSGEAAIMYLSHATGYGGSPSSTSGSSHQWIAGAGPFGVGGNKWSIGNANYAGVIFTVTHDGKVGIGTSSPGAPLSFANATGQKIDFYYTTGSGGDRYGIQVQSSELRIHSGALGASTGGITFGKQTTSAFTENMRITNAGNVGIGTTSPVAKLSVTSGSTAYSAHFGRYDDEGLFLHSDGSSGHYNWRITTQTEVDGGFEIAPSTGTGGTTWADPIFVIKQSGKVGVGKHPQAPISPLSVSSSGGEGDWTHGWSTAHHLTVVAKGDNSGIGIYSSKASGAAYNTKYGYLRFGSDTLTTYAGGFSYSHFSNDMWLRVYGKDMIKLDKSGPTLYVYMDATTSYAAVYGQATNASHTSSGIIRALSVRSASTYFNYFRAGTISDNEFILRGDGNGYADGSWTSPAADYAEYFEWNDGNPSSEDRVGITVSLIGNKIQAATEGDEIIGVVSANPVIVGDAAWNKWQNKYLVDDYNRYQTETVETVSWEETPLPSEDDEEPSKVTHSYIFDSIPEGVTPPDDAERRDVDRRILNPDYDPDQTYVPREDRPEWDTIGLVGKLRIRKGQPTAAGWIKMRDISDTVEEWLVK